MFKSVRSRLTLWYALVLILVFLVSDIILYRSFKASLLETIDNSLLAAAEEVETAIAKVPFKQWKTTVKEVERGFLVNRMFIQLMEPPAAKEGDFQLIARSGVLSGNISHRKIWEELEFRLPAGPLYMDMNEETPAKHPLRIILYPVRRAGEKGCLIEAGTSLRKLQETLDNFLVILLVSGPVLLLFSVVGGYLILSRALLPVKSVVQTAQKITTENLSQRIEAKNRRDEIGQLVTTFNRMISRLERSVAQIKQFSGDASHDMKTPLTVIKGEIDLALRRQRKPGDYVRTLTNVREEADRLERVIDNLLFLSSLDAREYSLSFARVALDEVLLQVFEKTERLAVDKGLVYLLTGIDTVPVKGDAILLSRLVMNLLDNAIKYTPSGGRVEISLKKINREAVLRVRDSGSGIPQQSQPFIFDRFYRVDESRSRRSAGSGLGLSIVKKIAQVHNAQVEVESEPGQGSAFAVRFPADE